MAKKEAPAACGSFLFLRDEVILISNSASTWIRLSESECGLDKIGTKKPHPTSRCGTLRLAGWDLPVAGESGGGIKDQVVHILRLTVDIKNHRNLLLSLFLL